MYNKSEIMKSAWRQYKRLKAYGSFYEKTFAHCLKEAWKDAKYEAEYKAGKNVELEIQNKKSIIIKVNEKGGAVTGNTFAVKEVLKRYGCTWNAADKSWDCDFEDALKIAQKFAA